MRFDFDGKIVPRGTNIHMDRGILVIYVIFLGLFMVFIAFSLNSMLHFKPICS